MFQRVRTALEQIQAELAKVLDPSQITAACRTAGYRFRVRVLDPVATIHLFVLQVLKGNCAIARSRS